MRAGSPENVVVLVLVDYKMQEGHGCHLVDWPEHMAPPPALISKGGAKDKYLIVIQFNLHCCFWQ